MHGNYQSFLLRIWPGEPPPISPDSAALPKQRWHASIQKVPDGERIGFSDMADILTFLESLTAPEQSDQDEAD